MKKLTLSELHFLFNKGQQILVEVNSAFKFTTFSPIEEVRAWAEDSDQITRLKLRLENSSTLEFKNDHIQSIEESEHITKNNTKEIYITLDNQCVLIEYEVMEVVSR